MAGGIQNQPVGIDHILGSRLRSPSQHSVDAGQQFAGREWLRHVVVGTTLKTHYLVLLFCASRQHDDRNFLGVLVTLESTRELKPAHVRQHPVDEDEVGPVVRDTRTSGADILDFAHFKSAAAQSKRNHLAYGALIFDDQDLFDCHAFLGILY